MSDDQLARRALLANMRHELQTPVTAISDYIEMLYQDTADSGANEVLLSYS